MSKLFLPTWCKEISLSRFEVKIYLGHFQKYHNTLYLSLQNFAQAFFFILSWDLQWSQERLETMLLQNFGGTKTEYYGIFESGPLNSGSATIDYFMVDCKDSQL